MTHIVIWIESPLALAMAKTLLHSLWQAGLTAFALAVCLRLMHAARLRYAAACAALIVVITLSIVTFAFVVPRSERQHSLAQSASPAMPVGSPAVVGPASQPAPSLLQIALRWITPIWLLGFLVFNLRQIASWAAASRMRKRGVCMAPDAWQQRLNVLRSRMKILKPVLLLESCMAQVPLVVGHVRPAILAPLGFLACLPAEQVELLLMHELAHIRRCDYLINMLQTFLESMMFYNPAVWWISNLIRSEREHCCDDVAMATANNGMAFAAALTALEDSRSHYAQLVMTATGGSLMKRVRRILGQPEPPSSVIVPLTGAAMVLLVVSGLLLARPMTRPQPRSRPLSSAVPSMPLTLPGHGPASPRVRQSTPAAPVNSGLQASYQQWLDQDVVYIVTAAERAAYLGLSSDDARNQFIEQFWQRRDPTPGTAKNEFKEEHYARIAYANEHFASVLPLPSGMGWRADRGRTYIQFGPPDEKESHPAGTYVRADGTTQPFASELWLYRHLEGIGNNVLLEFVDPNGTGEFPQTIDPAAKHRLGEQLGQILGNLPPPGRQEIYVVGEVRMPGAFLLRAEDRTLLHALTVAQGIKTETAGSTVAIVRFSNSGGHEEFKIDFRRLVTGADMDIPLQPNDIVFVPRP